MKKYLIILVGIAVIVSACAQGAIEPASLIGITWKLTGYGRVGSPEPAASEEGFITFSTDGTLTGIGACNRFEGDYEVRDNQITLSQLVWDVGGNVYCPYPQMSQESGVYQVLKGTVDFKIKDNTMTITKDEIFLEFETVTGK
jgi:heat shock protein HslJ